MKSTILIVTVSAISLFSCSLPPKPMCDFEEIIILRASCSKHMADTEMIKKVTGISPSHFQSSCNHLGNVDSVQNIIRRIHSIHQGMEKDTLEKMLIPVSTSLIIPDIKIRNAVKFDKIRYYFTAKGDQIYDRSSVHSNFYVYCDLQFKISNKSKMIINAKETDLIIYYDGKIYKSFNIKF